MNRTLLASACLALSFLAGSALAQTPVGTTFTYQGRLTDAGNAPTGTYDMQFELWDSLSGGTQLGSTLTQTGVSVSAGVFTASLDFGERFNANKLFLRILVKRPASVSYTELLPRQEMTGTPYALGLKLPIIESSAQGISAISIVTNPGVGNGVIQASSTGDGHGILGTTNSTAFNAAGVYGESFGTNVPVGVYGRCTAVTNGTGVTGFGSAVGGYFQGQGGGANLVGAYGVANGSGSRGVYGTSDYVGVWGVSSGSAGSSWGVYGESPAGYAVYGTGDYGAYLTGTSYGLWARCGTLALIPGVAAIRADAPFADGIYTTSGGTGKSAIYAKATSSTGIAGAFDQLNGGVAVQAHATGNDAIVAFSDAPNKSGVFAYSNSATGCGGCFANYGGGVALGVDGLAQVKVLQILGGSDVAEPFDVWSEDQDEKIEAGMVMSIDPAHPGELTPSSSAYDTRVAGVISGANGIEPGMVLRSKGNPKADGEHPIAMSGRVWVWCDASTTTGGGAITPGDRLTTSATRGHAMRASDSARAPGAVIGKAMTDLKEGRGMVLVLVNLQ